MKKFTELLAVCRTMIIAISFIISLLGLFVCCVVAIRRPELRGDRLILATLLSCVIWTLAWIGIWGDCKNQTLEKANQALDEFERFALYFCNQNRADEVMTREAEKLKAVYDAQEAFQMGNWPERLTFKDPDERAYAHEQKKKGYERLVDDAKKVYWLVRDAAKRAGFTVRDKFSEYIHTGASIGCKK